MYNPLREPADVLCRYIYDFDDNNIKHRSIKVPEKFLTVPSDGRHLAFCRSYVEIQAYTVKSPGTHMSPEWRVCLEQVSTLPFRPGSPAPGWNAAGAQPQTQPTAGRAGSNTCQHAPPQGCLSSSRMHSSCLCSVVNQERRNTCSH